jgi:hypothetical protein
MQTFCAKLDFRSCTWFQTALFSIITAPVVVHAVSAHHTTTANCEPAIVAFKTRINAGSEHDEKLVVINPMASLGVD